MNFSSSERSFTDLKGDSDDYAHMSKILDHEQEKEFCGDLYLGDYVAATDLKNLRSKNIKTVITCAVDLDVKYGYHLQHIVYEMLDSEKQNIYQYLEKAPLAIYQALKKGSILVHCTAGISRSATLVIAFVMKYKEWNFQQSLNFVKSKRYMICPNRGFVTQLKTFGKIMEKNKNNDQLLEQIKNTNKEIAFSLQSEIEQKNPQFAKQMGMNSSSNSQRNIKTNQQQQYQQSGIQQRRKNSRAHSAKGFRLIDLVDIDNGFKQNISYISQQYYMDDVKTNNEQNLDMSQIDLEKLTQVPTPPQNKKINDQLSKVVKRSNSQQKLHQMTEKLLKEEIDISYNKFEYKPRFKRLTSPSNNINNSVIENSTPRGAQNLPKRPISSIQYNQNNNNNKIPPLKNQGKFQQMQEKSGQRSQRNIINQPQQQQQKQILGINKNNNNKLKGYGQKPPKGKSVKFDNYDDEDPLNDHNQLIQEFQQLEQEYLGEHMELDQNITLSRRKSGNFSGLPPKPAGKKRFQV